MNNIWNYVKIGLNYILRAIQFVWALPLTIFGWLVCLLGTRYLATRADDWSMHFVAKQDGKITVIKWYMNRLNIWAMTLGAVIIYSGSEAVANEQIVTHERTHVKQCYRYGVLSILLYIMASIVAAAYGQDWYRGNDAEEQARYESGDGKTPDDIKPKDRNNIGL
jgi:cellobiose-specific phosphotransferase system component IIC